VKQRLPTGKHGPLDTEPFDIRELIIELFGTDLIKGSALPDIAHRAVTVARTVRVHDENRESQNDQTWNRPLENGISRSGNAGAPVSINRVTNGAVTQDCPAIPRTYTEAPRDATARLRFVYRVEQIAAAILLVILSPLAAAIAIAIFALSRRGPLISHNRVGWHGEPIAMLKFRTMWGEIDPCDAFKIVENVDGHSSNSKQGMDPRVTSRFAALCRRFSLDELPQLYHVVRGEMSLVGPRPLTLRELQKHYGPSTHEVLSLRPGLTGLWQLKGRSRLTYAQRRRLDLLLVRRMSAGLYLRILFQSVPKVLAGADAC
jgi:exopolysaccharide production protein ExoY